MRVRPGRARRAFAGLLAVTAALTLCSTLLPSAARADGVGDDDYVTDSCATAAKATRVADGQEGYLTAGHCPLPDDAFLERWVGGAHDVAIVYRDRLPAPPEDARTVTSALYDPSVEFGTSTVCKLGGVTGDQCGTVLTTDYAPRGAGYASDTYGFMVVGGTLCLPGDSGGPWYLSGGPQDGAFWGVTSGGVGGKRDLPAGSCIVSKAWDLFR